jgi:hypothetical protein
MNEPFNLVGSATTPGSSWGAFKVAVVVVVCVLSLTLSLHPPAQEESTVIVRRSELVQGVLDKSQFGAKKKFGLVHACFQLYGAEYSSLGYY